jgi:DNA-binding LacI/PurR family transcriptional regulator/DNA-binding transcriptional regulator YhcF (GntR family)
MSSQGSKVKAPGQERALAALRDAMRSPGPLPGLQTLARRVGVAYMTMWKAAAALRRQGVLTAHRGIGMRSAPAASIEGPASHLSTTRAPAARQRWQEVSRRITAEILDDAFGDDEPLPTAKELAARYGVCHRTLQRSLQQALTEGRLVLRRRRYHVPGIPRDTSSSSVLVVYRSVDLGSTPPTNEYVGSVIRSIEQACGRQNIRFGLAGYGYHEARLVTEGGKALPALSRSERKALCGIIVITQALGDQGPSLVAELAHFGKPIAIIDTRGVSESEFLPAVGRSDLYRIGLDESVGHALAQYLLRMGHRAIAYVSPMHQEGWSRLRLAGVTRAMAQAGCLAPPPTALHPDASDLPRTQVPARPAVAQVVEDNAARLQSLLGDEAAAALASDAVMEALAEQMRKAGLRRQLFPLLDQLAAKREVTAWIACNDLTAVVCLEYLRQRCISVPGRISLTGVDDSVLASHHGLTSYSRNEHGAINRILHGFFDPRRSADGAARPSVHDVEGRIVARASAAPPGRPAGP